MNLSVDSKNSITRSKGFGVETAGVVFAVAGSLLAWGRFVAVIAGVRPEVVEMGSKLAPVIDASDCMRTPKVLSCSGLAFPAAASCKRFASVGFDNAAVLTWEMRSELTGASEGVEVALAAIAVVLEAEGNAGTGHALLAPWE